jgi:hypothetical protein
MTCLPNALCARELMVKTSDVYCGARGGNRDAVDDDETHVNVRRIVFFGGQSEGIPFEVFGDLYLLCIEDIAAGSARKARAAWVDPTVTGEAPSPRCGHTTSLISSELLLVTGGSMGVSPIFKLDVFLLHIDGCSGTCCVQ